jgi:cob(I)alamin adenosyltransferase
MAQEKNSFDLPAVTSCPDGQQFDYFRQLLKALATSRHLRKTLDNLISVILLAEAELKNPDYAPHHSFLEGLTEKCYPLVAALCDQDSITYEEILTISAKRRITESYLPNHFFGTEPDHVPIADYYLDMSEEAQNKVVRRESELKKKHLLQTAASLDPLFKKTYPTKRVGEQQADVPAQIPATDHDAPASPLLKLKEEYLEKEALAKMILDFRVRRYPGDKEGASLLRVYELGSYEKFSLPGFEEATAILEQYRQAYQKILDDAATPPELQDLLKTIDAAFLHLQGEFEQDKQSLVHASKQEISFATLQHLAKVRHTIWCMSKEIEKQQGFYLSAVRKALVDATPYHPGQLSGFLKFVRENPKYFSRKDPNKYLRVEYLYRDEEREKYRVHIRKGKCYKVVRSYHKVELVPFSSVKESSHRKKDWVSFVMNRNGEIFAASHDVIKHRLHSSFMAGAPVFFPGEMKVAPDGTILEISNYSGHYGPSLEAMEAFARHLSERRKVDVSKINFYAVDKKGLQESLDRVEEDKELSEEIVERTKEALENQSEELKSFRKCYQFVDGKFKEIDLPADSAMNLSENLAPESDGLAEKMVAATKHEPLKRTASSSSLSEDKFDTEIKFRRVVWIGFLTMVVIAGIVLAGAVILATKGIAAPFIGGLVIKAAALGSGGSVPMLPALGAVASLLVAAPLLILNSVFKWTQSLGRWVGGLFGSEKSNPPVGETRSRPPEPVVRATPPSVGNSALPSVASSDLSSLRTSSEKKVEPPSYTAIRQLIDDPRNQELVDKTVTHPGGYPKAQLAISRVGTSSRREPEQRTNSSFIGVKRKFEEWTRFEDWMGKIANKDQGNKLGLGVYVTWLKADLDALQNKLLASQDINNRASQDYIKKWTEENIVNLMLRVASKLSDNREGEFLAKVEAEFFTPLGDIIFEFWKPFRTAPVDVLSAYQTQRANLLRPEQQSVVAP